MQNRLLTRFWVEVVLGLMSAAWLALVLVGPDWVEGVFGFSPDAGDGSAEWALALGSAAVSVLMSVSAGRTWRKRARLLAST